MKRIAVKKKFVDPIFIGGKKYNYISNLKINSCSHPVFCISKAHSQYFATNSNSIFPSFDFRQETAEEKLASELTIFSSGNLYLDKTCVVIRY